MRRSTIALSCLFVLAFGPAAWAAEPHDDGTEALATPQSAEGAAGWEWAIGAYLHAVDISGTSTIGEDTSELDLSFDMLVDKLEMAFSARAEGWSPGGFGLGADFMYIKIGDDGLSTPLPGVTIDTAEFKISQVELFGGYRFGSPSGSAGAFDFLGGARYKGQSLTAAITLPDPLPGQTGGFDEGWWDYMAGGRWILERGRWSFIARADFGAHAYNIQGGLGFSASDHWKLMLQYKLLDFDYSTGSGADRFAYDAQEKGFLLGIIYAF